MLQIKSIPAFSDNYIWLIQNNQQCIVVDPGAAAPVLDVLNQQSLSLQAILITHHHKDHTGGVEELKRHFPNVSVIGPKHDPVLGLTKSVDEGDEFTLLEQHFHVLGLSGHTKGHIGFKMGNALFCGDVLFSAGCGRVIEGTHQQMFDALAIIAQQSDDTLIYCAHEYTSSNLAFALAVEPENQTLLTYREQVNRLRANGKPTLPTSLQLEKRINPFLRTSVPEVIKGVSMHTQQHDPLAIFSALRQWKNEF